MSKVAAPSTLSPLFLAPGVPVVESAEREVIEQQNEDVATWCPVLLAWNGTRDGVLSASSPLCMNLGFTAAINTWRTPLRSHLRLSADYQVLRVAAECVLEVGDAVQVRVTVGGTSVTLSFTDANNGSEVSTTLAVVAEGLVTVTVETRRTAGGTNGVCVDGRIQVEPIAAEDLPDPTDA